MKRVLAVGALVAFGSIANDARADDDPWLGHDKFLHASVSGTLANLTYAGGTQLFDARGSALLAAAGVTLAIGAAKETIDLTGAGDPSWKDFTWDVIGTAAGLAIAYAMDLFVRGTEPARHPLFFAPSAQLQSFVLRF